MHSDPELQTLALALLPVFSVLFFVGGWVFLCFGGEGEGLQEGRLFREPGPLREGSLTEVRAKGCSKMGGGGGTKEGQNRP